MTINFPFFYCFLLYEHIDWKLCIEQSEMLKPFFVQVQINCLSLVVDCYISQVGSGSIVKRFVQSSVQPSSLSVL